MLYPLPRGYCLSTLPSERCSAPFRMAMAAYETAVRYKLGIKITLRQGIRVVRKNWELPDIAVS